MLRWCILFLVRLDLTLDPKVYAAMQIFAQIRGPQSGVRLAHCAEAVLHCSSFDGLVEGDQPNISISFAEDLEHGDGILSSGKLGIDIVGQAECIPARPMLFHGVGTLFCNSVLDALVDKAEIRA
jgi:hypothetical protein